MDIVERARAILRMRTNDAGRYHELLTDYNNCVQFVTDDAIDISR